jgi:hypothetical protein
MVMITKSGNWLPFLKLDGDRRGNSESKPHERHMISEAGDGVISPAVQEGEMVQHPRGVIRAIQRRSWVRGAHRNDGEQ